MPTSEAVGIFRAALRMSRKIPAIVIRRKFRANARELVEYYSFNSNPAKSSEQLKRGWSVLATLEGIFDADPQATQQLLKPFEFMIPKVPPLESNIPIQN